MRNANKITQLKYGASMFQTRPIYAKNIYEDRLTNVKNNQDMDDIKVYSRGGAGLVRMNKEHRFNILTPHLASQVSRGVKSMDMDHTVEVIFLGGRKGQQFTNGTDFKTLLYLRDNKGPEEAASFLHKIHKLQLTFASINKPIMSVGVGNCLNSGAGMLLSSGIPSVSKTTKIAFNECSFGFTPHAGATYHCSRMEGDFGTFMLLTGMPISGYDALKMKLAD